jgi:hypothetical protein
MHEQYVWRFLRAQKIDLSGRTSWCESNDPEFVAKAAEDNLSTHKPKRDMWLARLERDLTITRRPTPPLI